MVVNELVDRLNELAGQIKGKEQEATKHEQVARVCRAEREEFKREQSELNANINDAKIVNALQSSAASAKAAQTVAEQSAVAVNALVVKLEAELVKLKAKLVELGDTAEPDTTAGE